MVIVNVDLSDVEVGVHRLVSLDSKFVKDYQKTEGTLNLYKVNATIDIESYFIWSGDRGDIVIFLRCIEWNTSKWFIMNGSMNSSGDVLLLSKNGVWQRVSDTSDDTLNQLSEDLWWGDPYEAIGWYKTVVDG